MQQQKQREKDLESINKKVSLPQVWGKAMWTSMHCVAARIPDEPTLKQREEIAQYYNSLKSVLPCLTCQHDYGQLLKADPVYPHTVNKTTLSVWVWRIHNAVNKKLGVPMYPFSIITSLYGIEATPDMHVEIMSTVLEKKTSNVKKIHYLNHHVDEYEKMSFHRLTPKIK